MGKVQERISAALSAEVASRTEWDEDPVLYFLYLEGGQPVLRPFELPDFVWALDWPPRVLVRMADGWEGVTELLSAVAPEGLHGAAFRHEMWMATGERDSAKAAEHQAAAEAHLLHLHPDRVEARAMWAVDRAGTTYGVVLRRDLDRKPQTLVSYPGPQREIQGSLPRALERIVSAVLGVTMP